MTAEEILFEAEMSMEKSVDHMVHEFSAVRTGKASPNLVENVDVEAVQAAYPGSTLHARNTWRLLEYLRDGDDGDVLRA